MKDLSKQVYLYSFWGSKRFVRTYEHKGYLYVYGVCGDGVKVDMDELTPFEELVGKRVKHKTLGVMGVLRHYCTTEVFENSVWWAKERHSNRFVWVRWDKAMAGWVNINDLEFF